VTFTEKLAHLTAGKNKAKIARESGLSPTAINDYLQRGYVPRADNALALSRSLGVPLEWLVDDTQGLPPPTAAPINNLSTPQLAEELGQRMLSIGLLFLGKIERARDVDWVDVAKKLLPLDPKSDKQLPKSLREIVEIVDGMGLLTSELRHYEPRAKIGDSAPVEILKSYTPDYELRLLDLHISLQNLRHVPGFGPALELASLWMIPDFIPKSGLTQEHVEYVKEKAAAELASLPSPAEVTRLSKLHRPHPKR
jgi:transcriptional regulator with XRE-family HTH domain